MDVNFEKPDIYQLFSESQGIIHIVNAVMKPFLKCFGVKEENGLSLFCRDFSSKEEPKHELELFFPKISKIYHKTTIVDHSDIDQQNINE